MMMMMMMMMKALKIRSVKKQIRTWLSLSTAENHWRSSRRETARRHSYSHYQLFIRR